jgi:hypothetical protein
MTSLVARASRLWPLTGELSQAAGAPRSSIETFGLLRPNSVYSRTQPVAIGVRCSSGGSRPLDAVGIEAYNFVTYPLIELRKAAL